MILNELSKDLEPGSMAYKISSDRSLDNPYFEIQWINKLEPLALEYFKADFSVLEISKIVHFVQ